MGTLLPGQPVTPAAPTGSRTTRRFQSWELNGRGKPTGVWPIPTGQSPGTFTEVDTVASGAVVEVREHHQDQPKPLVRVFTTGKGGRLDAQSYRDPVTNISGRNTYEYDDKTGLMVARTEWDGQNRMRYRIEVTCDANGRFKEERILDSAKRPVARHVYAHDTNGRVIRDETWGGKGLTVLKGFHHITHDAKGRITRRAWCEASGAEKEAFVYTYDAMDRRVEMAIEKNGTRSLTAVTTFDAIGSEISTRYVEANGKPLADGPARFEPGDPDALAKAMEGLDDRLREVANKDPGKLDLIAQVGYAQFEAGQYDQARRIFEGLTTLAPGVAYYPSAVAAVALQQGQPHTALNYYDRALLRDPKHVPSLVGRGDALLQLGRTQDGLVALSSAVKLGKAGEPTLKRARALLTALGGAGVAPKAGTGRAQPAPTPRR